MVQPRERSIERTRGLLESSGFFISDVHAVRPTSFDLMARRDSVLLLVKVLKNIDALDAGEASRLVELGRLFPASILVIGETSGGAKLESGVVYNRHGVPIVSEETLQDLLHEGVPPFLSASPGGTFARIDGPRLRRLREARGLSLGALATIAGVSRRTVQLYESGGGADVEIVHRIEVYLDEPIARPIRLFRVEGEDPTTREPPAAEGDGEGPPPEDEPRARRRRPAPVITGDRLRDGVFRELGELGWQVMVTIRAPFDALSVERPNLPRQTLITAVGSPRLASQRADLLARLARVAEVHALFVVPGRMRQGDADGLPVLTIDELRRQRGRQELLDTLADRSGV